MLTVKKSLQFSHPSLINFNPNTVSFDDRNVLDRADLRAEDTSDSVLDRLVIGNQQFVEHRAQQLPRNNSVRLSGAAKGNNPFAAILNYANYQLQSKNYSIENLANYLPSIPQFKQPLVKKLVRSNIAY